MMRREFSMQRGVAPGLRRLTAFMERIHRRLQLTSYD